MMHSREILACKKQFKKLLDSNGTKRNIVLTENSLKTTTTNNYLILNIINHKKNPKKSSIFKLASRPTFKDYNY